MSSSVRNWDHIRYILYEVNVNFRENRMDHPNTGNIGHKTQRFQTKHRKQIILVMQTPPKYQSEPRCLQRVIRSFFLQDSCHDTQGLLQDSFFSFFTVASGRVVEVQVNCYLLDIKELKLSWSYNYQPTTPSVYWRISCV